MSRLTSKEYTRMKPLETHRSSHCLVSRIRVFSANPVAGTNPNWSILTKIVSERSRWIANWPNRVVVDWAHSSASECHNPIGSSANGVRVPDRTTNLPFFPVPLSRHTWLIASPSRLFKASHSTRLVHTLDSFFHRWPLSFFTRFRSYYPRNAQFDYKRRYLIPCTCSKFQTFKLFLSAIKGLFPHPQL